MSDGIMGVRRYIINDDDSTLKAAKKRMFRWGSCILFQVPIIKLSNFRLKILHHLLVNIFLAFGCYLAYLLMAKVWKIIV